MNSYATHYQKTETLQNLGFSGEKGGAHASRTIMLDELQENKKALSKSEKENAWREMAKQVAHEIKNPLTPMKLMLQHVERKLKLINNESVQDSSKSIQSLINQVDTLSDIAGSFATFAQMPNPSIEKIDLVTILKEQLNVLVSDKGVNVHVDIKSAEIWVDFDPRLFGRIVLNLLLNAKESVDKNNDIDIRVNLFVEGRFIRLEVEDNGCGIPEELAPKVFIPNFTTKSTGSGIGLAVAKKGVEYVNGKIWFEPNLPKGTRFMITLPLSC